MARQRRGAASAISNSRDAVSSRQHAREVLAEWRRGVEGRAHARQIVGRTATSASTAHQLAMVATLKPTC